MTSLEWVSSSPEETIAIGRRLGSALRPSDVVLLYGELGAGKTTLAQGIVAGYGVEAVVTSPTFALIHVHRTGTRTVVHVDPYRLAGPDDIESTGLEEYLGTDALVLVEWPERLGPWTPADSITVRIGVLPDDRRTIAVCAPRDLRLPEAAA